VFFFFGILGVSLIQSCKQKLRKRGDKKRLDALRELLKSKKRIPTPICAICLVDFEPQSHTDTPNTSQDKELGTSPEQVRLRKKELKGNPPAREETNTKEEIETLVCGHQFHAQCIQSWLAVKNNCPVCRQDRPRDPPSDEDKDDQTYPKSRTRSPVMLDNYILDFAYLRLNTPYYYSRHIPYVPPSSTSSRDSGFGGGSSFGGGGAGGGW